MKRDNVSIQSAFYLVGAVVLLTFLQGCGFCHGVFTFCNQIKQTPITAASGEPPAVVFEDPGIIKVMHGSGCAHLDKGGGIFHTLEQSIDIPAYATKAAVFLNGWKLKYSGGDHHVAALAAAIGKIKLEPGKLTWSAVGVLEDYPGLFGHLKAIDWCDWYTVVAWNDANLHAFVDQGDAEYFCKSGGMPSGSDNFFFAWNSGTTTALSWFPSFLYNASFPSGPSVAILPRGFGFWWWCGDHHLFQVAYNLEHSENFIQSWKYKKAGGHELNPLATPPTGRVDSGFVSWGTYSILKDNATRRDHLFGELVSAMGGPDVGIIQPPFAILPLEGLGGGGHVTAGSVGVETKDVVIDNVPYAYAIPMLTGWDLNYDDNDHHMREVGIWLDDLHYAAGTLSYKVSSVLHDDSGNGHFSRHKITILGLRPSGGVPIR